MAKHDTRRPLPVSASSAGNHWPSASVFLVLVVGSASIGAGGAMVVTVCYDRHVAMHSLFHLARTGIVPGAITGTVIGALTQRWLGNWLPPITTGLASAGVAGGLAIVAYAFAFASKVIS